MQQYALTHRDFIDALRAGMTVQDALLAWGRRNRYMVMREQMQEKIAKQETVVVRTTERNTDQLSMDQLLRYIMAGPNYHP